MICRAALSAAVACFVVTSGNAKTTAWIGGAGSLSNEAGWNNGFPADGDTAIISNTTDSAISVQNDLEDMKCEYLTLSGSDNLTLWGNPITISGCVTVRAVNTVVSNDVTSTRGDGTFVSAYKTCHFYGTMTHTTGNSELYTHKDGTGSVTFHGPVNCSGRKVTFYTKKSYPITFKNTLKASSTTGTWTTGYNGNIYFDAPGSEIDTMTANYSTYYIRGENFFPSNVVLSFTAHEGSGHFRLNGFNQTINRIANGGAGSGNANSIYSESPAVLTLKAKANSKTASRICDAITIVYDAQGDYVQTFANRKHLTTGNIIVKNGTFRMDGTNYFASVPEVTVADSAKFDVATTNSGALAAVTSLTLGSNSRFSVVPTAVDVFGTKATYALVRASSRFVLPAGATLRVDTLVVDGVPVAAGEYSQTADGTRLQLAQVEGEGTLVVDTTPAGTYWTGANGADWDDAGNWTAGVPAAGVEAHIEKIGAVAVSLSAASAVSAGGLFIENMDGTTTLNVDSDLSLAGGGFKVGRGATMTVGADATFVWDGSGVASDASVETVSIRDGGVLELEGGRLQFTNTTGRVALGGGSDASPGTLRISSGTCMVYRTSGDGFAYLKGSLLQMTGGRFMFNHEPIQTGGVIDCSGDAVMEPDFVKHGSFFKTISMRLAGSSKIIWTKKSNFSLWCRFDFTPNNAGETTLVEVLDSASFDFEKGDYIYFGNKGTSGTTAILRADTSGRVTFGNSGGFGVDGGHGEFVLSNGVAKATKYSFYLGSASSSSITDVNPSGTMRMYGGSFTIGNRDIATHIDGFLIGDGQKSGSSYASCHPTGLLELHGGSMSISSWLVAGIGGGDGTIRQSGGTLDHKHTTRPMVIGLKGGTGLYEMTGGVCTNKSGVYVGGCTTNILKVNVTGIRNNLPGHGTLNISGGTFNSTKDVYVGFDGYGAFNVGTGGVVRAVNMHVTNSYDSVAGETVAGALSFTFGPEGVGRVDLSGALKVAPGATLTVDVSRFAGRKDVQLLNCASMERAFAPEDVTIVTDKPSLWNVVQSGTGLRLVCNNGSVILFR